MNVLLLVAHPADDSFTAALADAFAAGAAEAGHQVLRRDLYALGFDPVLRRAELRGGADADARAWQAQLAGADALALAYPVWWGMPPAILGGWAQRVLTYGFAFDKQGGRLPIPVQILAAIGSQGRQDADLERQYFDPLRGVLRYCGMTVRPVQACWGVNAQTPPELLHGYLDAARQAGRDLLPARATA